MTPEPQQQPRALDPEVARVGLGFMQANLTGENRGQAFRPERPALAPTSRSLRSRAAPCEPIHPLSVWRGAGRQSLVRIRAVGWRPAGWVTGATPASTGTSSVTDSPGRSSTGSPWWLVCRASPSRRR